MMMVSNTYILHTCIHISVHNVDGINWFSKSHKYLVAEKNSHCVCTYYVLA